MELMPEKIFTVGMKSNVDWEAWEKLSRLKGISLCDQTSVLPPYSSGINYL